MSNKRGFTLPELLAVVVVLSIIILIAGNAVMTIFYRSKELSQEEMISNLKEAGLEYVIGNIYLEKCSENFSKEIYENNDISNIIENSSCLRIINVETLKENGLFEDSKGYCNNDEEVIVYRYNDGVNSDYRAFVSSDVCNN